MKAIKGNMIDQILHNDHKILRCPECGAEYSRDAGDYWYLPDDYVFYCYNCGTEMELVKKITTVRFEE